MIEALLKSYQAKQAGRGVTGQNLLCRNGVLPGEEMSCSEAFLNDLESSGLTQALIGHCARCNRRRGIAKEEEIKGAKKLLPILGLAGGVTAVVGLSTMSCFSEDTGTVSNATGEAVRSACLPVDACCAQQTETFEDGHQHHSWICSPCF